MRRGTLILTMPKMRAAETWPSFERNVQSVHEIGTVAVPVGAVAAAVPVAVTAPFAVVVPVEYDDDTARVAQAMPPGTSAACACAEDNDEDAHPAASSLSSSSSPSSSSSSSSSSWESLQLNELLFFCCGPTHGDDALPPRHTFTEIRPEMTAGLSEEDAAVRVSSGHVASMCAVFRAGDNSTAPAP